MRLVLLVQQPAAAALLRAAHLMVANFHLGQPSGSLPCPGCVVPFSASES